MNVVLRLLTALLASLIGWIGFTGSAAAGSALTAPPATYTYGNPGNPAALSLSATERGPPATYDRATTYDTVDLQSHGAVARSEGATPPATAYGAANNLVQVPRATGTTRTQAQVSDVPPVTRDRASVAAKAATPEIDASKLTMTKTVEQHLTEYAKDGTLARPYGDSRLTIQEIMRSGDPVPDPGGVPGALRWDAPGAFGKSSGTWELVVNPETNTILHFLFRSGQ